MGRSLGQEVLGLDNVVIPRTHEGSVTSCSPAVERKHTTHTHTHHIEIHHAKNLRLPGTHQHSTHHALCSQSAEKSPEFFSASFCPRAPVPVFPHTHTFRSTSLVPLEQVMTTQGGSAAMATPSATSSYPPLPSVLWWGPGRNSFSLSTRPHH